MVDDVVEAEHSNRGCVEDFERIVAESERNTVAPTRVEHLQSHGLPGCCLHDVDVLEAVPKSGSLDRSRVGRIRLDCSNSATRASERCAQHAEPADIGTDVQNPRTPRHVPLECLRDGGLVHHTSGDVLPDSEIVRVSEHRETRGRLDLDEPARRRHELTANELGTCDIRTNDVREVAAREVPVARPLLRSRITTQQEPEAECDIVGSRFPTPLRSQGLTSVLGVNNRHASIARTVGL